MVVHEKWRCKGKKDKGDEERKMHYKRGKCLKITSFWVINSKNFAGGVPSFRGFALSSISMDAGKMNLKCGGGLKFKIYIPAFWICWTYMRSDFLLGSAGWLDTSTFSWKSLIRSPNFCSFSWNREINCDIVWIPTYLFKFTWHGQGGITRWPWKLNVCPRSLNPFM